MMRMPLSKQRNKHIQRVLVEAAKLAPRESPELAMIRARELERGNPNRATLAVARKMVCYMLAVERRQQDFVPAGESIRPRLHKTLFLIRKKQKHRDLSKRRLPGPAGGRLSDGVLLPRLSPNCFGTGREHTLNHLRRLSSRRQQMDVWSCSGCRGHQP